MHYYYYYYLSYLYIYSYASQNMSPDVPMSRFYAQHGENKGLRWRDIALLWAGKMPLGAHRDLDECALALARPPTTFWWCYIPEPRVSTTPQWCMSVNSH